MQADELTKEIERAFNVCESPATCLCQYALTDRYGMSGEITLAQWEQAGRQRVDSKWQDIPDSEIEQCGCLLAHMQATEFAYYLPLYMRYALKCIDESIWQTDVIGSFVFSLSPSKKYPVCYAHQLAQLVLLDCSQRRVVVRFLHFVSVQADDVQRPDAVKALEGYWQHNAGR